MPEPSGYSRRTSAMVRVWDKLAKGTITVAGIGTIVAVSTVCIFLVSVVIPLFLPAQVDPQAASEPARWSADSVLHFDVDEYRSLAWTLSRDGELAVYTMSDGRLLVRRKLLEQPPTCASFAIGDDDVAFGFADGTVRLGRISFSTEFLEPEAATEEMRALEPGGRAVHDDGIVEKTAEGQFRLQKIHTELDEPTAVAAQPITLIDHTTLHAGPVFCALSADGKLHIKGVHSKKNLLTNKITRTLYGGEFALELGSRPLPSFLQFAGAADNAYVAWDDGHLIRVDTRRLEAPAVAEIRDIAPRDVKLTALRFMIGKTTLLSGHSDGTVRAWFRIKPEDATTVDGARLVDAHEFPATSGSAVTALTSSARTRMAAIGRADGGVDLIHITSQRTLASVRMPTGGSPRHVAIAPKDDGLLAMDDRGFASWRVQAEHPESSVAAIFGKVWYEGYEKPEHVWQSAGGEDAFEPKFGLTPLIFGTIKATFYSLLFGVPLALLAALYTSEFLHPSTKARIKPTIELMASLPSVVLGFLAAIVFAPFIVGYVPEALACIVTLPLTFLAGGYLWQLLPPAVGLRWQRFRFPIICAFLPVGLGLGVVLGPVMEDVFFAGDVFAWLDGQRGGGTGAWMLLLLPLSGVASMVLAARYVNPRLLQAGAGWSRGAWARADLLKFVATIAGAFLIAAGLSLTLSALGWDPRGTYVDTYVQRNSLVVGFVMGFAIIPIIYTVSEDALSSVPEHLRAASLGAGATPWQTAIRVILPTAMSGLFSAVMIGFGRAVGETMIVLMAAGNTPIMEWNIFNGFRTLSANIAVELPEAVQGGTNYRMLFLAALSLFVMTFAVNTIAEVVRQRFRRRAYQL